MGGGAWGRGSGEEGKDGGGGEAQLQPQMNMTAWVHILTTSTIEKHKNFWRAGDV